MSLWAWCPACRRYHPDHIDPVRASASAGSPNVRVETLLEVATMIFNASDVDGGLTALEVKGLQNELTRLIESASSAPPKQPLYITEVILSETNKSPVSAVCILSGCQHMTSAAPPEQELDLAPIKARLAEPWAGGHWLQDLVICIAEIERLRAALASRP